MTTADLLEQWREAVRASELAARLAKIAAESVERSTKGAAAAEELARLAERAAAAAGEAAATARSASDLAAEVARQSVEGQASDQAILAAARGEEESARGRYHEAEEQARQRIGVDGIDPTA